MPSYSQKNLELFSVTGAYSEENMICNMHMLKDFFFLSVNRRQKEVYPSGELFYNSCLFFHPR